MKLGGFDITAVSDFDGKFEANELHLLLVLCCQESTEEGFFSEAFVYLVVIVNLPTQSHSVGHREETQTGVLVNPYPWTNVLLC